jgi:hypothetical protein
MANHSRATGLRRRQWVGRNIQGQLQAIRQRANERKRHGRHFGETILKQKKIYFLWFLDGLQCCDLLPAKQFIKSLRDCTTEIIFSIYIIFPPYFRLGDLLVQYSSFLLCTLARLLQLKMKFTQPKKERKKLNPSILNIQYYLNDVNSLSANIRNLKRVLRFLLYC